MAIATSLLHEAQAIAHHQQQRVLALEQEILELEEELAAKKLALHLSRLAAQRLSQFVPQVGANFHCPRCFIENELRTFLDPSRGDFVSCQTCGSDFAV